MVEDSIFMVGARATNGLSGVLWWLLTVPGERERVQVDEDLE